MAPRSIKDVNPSEIALENIFMALENMVFGKYASALIVGGRRKLENLIVAGKIRVCKNASAKNSKWKCNAADVMRHCRNMRNMKNIPNK